uniref:Uncharacterized protein n=1 Tax=Tetradesmus obliquus TaxID=3088 RepID=A0A383VUW5_TETOB|eukprot:jgi/Sobl393_1/906/SZX69275.1
MPSLDETTLISCTLGTTCPGTAPVAVKITDGTTVKCITTNTPCPDTSPVAVKDQVGSTTGCIITDTFCPDTAPVAIKNQAGFTTDCISTDTPCPISNSLIFYSGSPSVRIECRVNPGGCNVPFFSRQACPVSATTSQLNYPVEVMLTDPSGCGGATGTCTTSRVIACYAPGTDCPAEYSLRFYSNPNGPDSTPELVECRQQRQACDLTAAGMGALDPNGGSYTIAVTNGQALDGCVAAGSSACPADYPIKHIDAVSGAFVSCGKSM